MDYNINKRILKPLDSEHPIVKDNIIKHTCWICKRRFYAGQRIMLVPKETTAMSGSRTVEAKPVHATCRLRGTEVDRGIIDRIKDGDASPYPIITTDNKQYKIEELGFWE